MHLFRRKATAEDALVFWRDMYILWCMVNDADKIVENDAMREALREVEDMKKIRLNIRAIPILMK